MQMISAAKSPHGNIVFAVEQALAGVPGVKSVAISLMQAEAKVEYSLTQTSEVCSNICCTRLLQKGQLVYTLHNAKDLSRVQLTAIF